LRRLHACHAGAPVGTVSWYEALWIGWGRAGACRARSVCQMVDCATSLAGGEVATKIISKDQGTCRAIADSLSRACGRSTGRLCGCRAGCGSKYRVDGKQRVAEGCSMGGNGDNAAPWLAYAPGLAQRVFRRWTVLDVLRRRKQKSRPWQPALSRLNPLFTRAPSRARRLPVLRLRP
jgi:hypothetical protein